MTQNHRQILSDAKSGKVSPIYFLSGEQEFFIDEVSRYFEKEFLSEDQCDFNQSIYYGRDIKMATIIDHAKRCPMMSSHQVIIVKEAQALSKHEWEKLSDYASKPLSSTILVFCYKHGSLDKRLSVSKQLSKNGVWLEEKRMYDRDFREWIVEHIRQKNYRIDDRAADMLLAFVGQDLSKISNEISKLLLSHRKEEPITAEHISQNIGISKDYNIFELQSALATRNAAKSNAIVRYFAANPKQSPMELLIGILYAFFVRGTQVAQLSDRSQKGISAALGMNYYAAQEYGILAQNYSQEKLYSIFGILREYDLRKKGLGAPFENEGALIQEMIYKILH